MSQTRAAMSLMKIGCVENNEKGEKGGGTGDCLAQKKML
jgi:hypothetical protein